MAKTEVMKEAVVVGGASVYGTGLDLNFDYTEFEEAERVEIIGEVINLKFEHRKAAEQLVVLGHAFMSLQKKTHGRFQAVCKAEFPEITYRSILRYIQGTGYIELSDLKNKMSLSTSAIYKLMNMDGEVFEAIREKIETKDKVSGADVQKLIDEVSHKNVELEKELVESQMSFAEQSQKLQEQISKNDQIELAARQLKDSLEATQKREARAREEAEAISNDLIVTQEKIAELEQVIIKKSQETEVAIQEIKVLPPEYKTLEEALKEQNKKLQEKQAELAKEQDKLAQVKAEINALETDKLHIKDQSSKLTEFMHSIQKVFEQYPVSVMSLMFNANGTHIDSLKSISSTLKQFTANIDSAVDDILLKDV